MGQYNRNEDQAAETTINGAVYHCFELVKNNLPDIVILTLIVFFKQIGQQFVPVLQVTLICLHAEPSGNTDKDHL